MLGYKNLDELRERLKPVLLRRTREAVMQQLPPRTTRSSASRPPTNSSPCTTRTSGSSVDDHASRYISEMDLLRLQKALLMCRMSADSTFLVDKKPPGYSSKLEELEELLDQLFAEQDRKILLFSEWTTMLDLIEPLAEKRDLPFVRLDGSVPQKKRQAARFTAFKTIPHCRLFITTNAGSTG